MVRPHILSTLLLLIVVLATGCKRTACFTIENGNYLNPNYPIQFRNCSENADEFLWDFGDGSTSSEAEPVHIYASAGEYEITMTVLNGLRREEVKEKINLQYAHIYAVKIVSMAATKPNGDPWDPDGSGADLALIGHKPGDPPGFEYTLAERVRNVVPPYELSGQGSIDLVGFALTLIDVNDPLVTDYDTVDYAYRSFEQLADNPVERVVGANVVYEILMGH